MSNQNDLETFDESEYPELNLTELETTLIAKNILFMKIIKLPSSRMKVIKDRTVCVPIGEATIKQTLQSLPRTPNEAGNVLHPVNWIVLHDVEDTKVYNSQGQGEYSRERRRNWKGQDCQASRVCGQVKEELDEVQELLIDFAKDQSLTDSLPRSRAITVPKSPRS